MATNVRDPRTLITPDAFRVSDEMLGLPLARPARRLWSILIDLIVISILTAMTADFTLVIWGVVGFFFLQMAFRNPGSKFGSVTAWLFRGATGCLGLLILAGVAIGAIAIGVGGDDVEEFARGMAEGAAPGIDPQTAEEIDAAVQSGGGLQAIRGLAGLASPSGPIRVVSELATVSDPDAAAALLSEALDIGYDDLGMRGEALADYLDALVEADAPYTDDPEAFEARVLAAWSADRGIDLGAPRAAATPEVDEAPAVDPLEVAKEVALLSPAQVFDAWAARVEAGDTLASDYRAVALRTRATELLAADSLGTLNRTTERLREQLDETREELSESQAALEAGQAGFTGLLRDIWDQLGSAFGLWSIYFTVMLTLFKGRTVGKIATRTRVVRLDGEPLTWWASFERCGGYFAGIATGLMGFAQVYWDPNRQCVHDKIVGTAVVMDGRTATPGAWQEAAGHDAGGATGTPGRPL